MPRNIYAVFFLLREKPSLKTACDIFLFRDRNKTVRENNFFLEKSSVQQEDTRMFFLRCRVSQGRRQGGVIAQETFNFVSDSLHSDSLFSPPLRAMSRSSSVEGRPDILARRGVEVIIFLRQEGCQGLQEDRRGNQSSHGKSTKLAKKPKKLFIYTLF